MTFKHFLKRATIDLSIILAVVLFVAASLVVFERCPEWKDEITERLESRREEQAELREDQKELNGLRTLNGKIEFGPKKLTLAELQTQLRGPGSKQGTVGNLVVMGWGCGAVRCPITAFFNVSGHGLQKELDPDSIAAELHVDVPYVADPAEFRNISVSGIYLGESAQEAAKHIEQNSIEKIRDDLANLGQDWFLRWYTRNGVVGDIRLFNVRLLGGAAREN
jgi:hypothetical protein